MSCVLNIELIWIIYTSPMYTYQDKYILKNQNIYTLLASKVNAIDENGGFYIIKYFNNFENGSRVSMCESLKIHLRI